MITDKMDLHTHTIASGHAYNTRNEMIAAAMEKELELLAITEHAPAMPGSCQQIYFSNYKVLPRSHGALTVLYGAELNILDYAGHVDLPEEILKEMDVVVASIHPPCYVSGTVEDNTTAYLGAMKNPYVNIIGHPDDGRFPIDYEALVKAAKEYHVLLEVNSTSLSPVSFRMGARDNYLQMLDLCVKYRVPVIVNSDAHADHLVGGHAYALEMLESLDFTQEQILNSSGEAIYEYIKYKTK